MKKELNIKTGYTGTTYQETLENSNCFYRDTIKTFFDDSPGYFWIFPRNSEQKEVNVGVVTFGKFGYNLRKMLTSFKEENNITGTINYIISGLIPLGLQHPFLYKNILFVGDAGVGTFPLTGQGIYRALMSGDIAGRCIAQRKFKSYPNVIWKEFMRWEVIGSTFIRMNLVFRKINPRLVFTSFNFLVNQGKQLSLFTH